MIENKKNRQQTAKATVPGNVESYPVLKHASLCLTTGDCTR